MAEGAVSKKLFDVARNFFSHLEHVNGIFRAKNFRKLVIRVDIALVFSVLTIIFFDINPELFDDLGAGHRAFSHNCRQIVADLYGLHESAILLFRWHVLLLLNKVLFRNLSFLSSLEVLRQQQLLLYPLLILAYALPLCTLKRN